MQKNDPLSSAEALNGNYLPTVSRGEFDLILQRHQVTLDSTLADQLYEALPHDAFYLDLAAQELAAPEALDPATLIARVSQNLDDLFTRAIARLTDTWAGRTMEEALGDFPHLWQYTFIRCSRRTHYFPTREQVHALQKLSTAFARTGYWEEAEAVARSIPVGSEQGDTLRDIAIALIGGKQWEQAITVIRSLPERVDQAQVLIMLATALQQAGQQEQAEPFWQQAETAVRSLPNNYKQADAFIKMAIALVDAQRWRQAEAVVRSIPAGSHRGRVFDEFVAALLRAENWEQAEILARSLSESVGQFNALSKFAAAMGKTEQREHSEQLWQEAEEIVHALPGRERSELTRKFLTALIEAARWEQAARVIHFIPESREQVSALIKLAAGLLHTNQRAQAELVLEQVTTIIHAMPDGPQQAQALREYALALAEGGRWEEAEAISHSIAHTFWGLWGQRDLALALARGGLWEQAEALLCSLPYGKQQELYLRNFISMLIEVQRWEQAEKIINLLLEDYDQAWESVLLAAAAAEAEQSEYAEELWKKAKGAAYSVPVPDQEANVLFLLAEAHADAAHWDKVVTIVSSIPQLFLFRDQLGVLVSMLINGKAYQQAFALIRYFALHEERPENVLCFLSSIVADLISLKPDLAPHLYQTFQWTNTFLKVGPVVPPS